MADSKSQVDVYILKCGLRLYSRLGFAVCILKGELSVCFVGGMTARPSTELSYSPDYALL